MFFGRDVGLFLECSESLGLEPESGRQSTTDGVSEARNGLGRELDVPHLPRPLDIS